MKKLTFALVLLLSIAVIGVFADNTISISGDSDLTWSFDDGSFATGDSGEFNFAPDEWTLSLEAVDEDGMVIVNAESTLEFDSGDDKDIYADQEDDFGFIEFPNAIPGVLGVKLNSSGSVGTGVTSTSSSTEVPNIVATLTAVDGLTVTAGVAIELGATFVDECYLASVDSTWFIDQEEFLADGVTPNPLWGSLIQDLTPAWGDDPANEIEGAAYTNFAIALEAAYALALGEEDSVTITLGTVFDTAYTSGVVLKSETLSTASVGTLAAPVADDQYYADYEYTAITVADTGAWDTVIGRATMPIGVAVDVAMAGITAGVDFETRLVEGKDADNVDAAAVALAYESPMFIGFDAAYGLAAGDMVITPNVNFKYSSDYWKWGVNSDLDGFEYKGDVQAAEFLGRQMSFGGGVDVTGIAGMVDVSLSGSYGLLPLDAEKNHMLVGAAHTGQDMLDIIEALNALAVADVNDKIFVTDLNALKVGVDLTINLMENLTVTNSTSYTHDGLGLLGADDATQYGNYMDKIANDLSVEYGILAGETLAVTLFGEFGYEMLYNEVEGGVAMKWDPALGYVLDKQLEEESTSSISYAFGVKATVSF